MTKREIHASLSLALVFSLRLLGLFMVLPVFALYARELPGATATAMGLALGIYGLTQALLQAPFGALSDRWGRKPVIAMGFVVFAVGSIMAGMADDIVWLTIGRALQGAGAVGAAINAYVADLTTPASRTKAMAIVGGCIGLAFVLALVLGPMLGSPHLLGVPGLFYLAAGLAGLCILVLLFMVPSAPLPPRDTSHHLLADLRTVLGDAGLLRLDFGIFTQHLVLTALFIAVPIQLHQAGFASGQQWELYLPVILLSIPGTLFLYRRGEGRGVTLHGMSFAVLLLLASQLALMFSQHNLLLIGAALVVYFAGFNLLEASLPSRASQVAPEHCRGVAMGIYSSMQFLGIFVGGALGGFLLGLGGPQAVFAMGVVMSLLWWLFGMRPALAGYNHPSNSSNSAAT